MNQKQLIQASIEACEVLEGLQGIALREGRFSDYRSLRALDESLWDMSAQLARAQEVDDLCEGLLAPAALEVRYVG